MSLQINDYLRHVFGLKFSQQMRLKQVSRSRLYSGHLVDHLIIMFWADAICLQCCHLQHKNFPTQTICNMLDFSILCMYLCAYLWTLHISMHVAYIYIQTYISAYKHTWFLYFQKACVFGMYKMLYFKKYVNTKNLELLKIIIIESLELWKLCIVEENQSVSM